MADAPERPPPPARLLDLSRLVSRVGRGAHTGIDRVELAYLDALLARPEPLFALVRAAPGFVLLDRAGAAALRARLTGAAAWGRPDALSRLHLRQHPARRRAMSDLRRLALGWALPGRLRRLMAQHLPQGTAWIATGHANLSAEVFEAVATALGGTSAVLIHDTIPLDHPDFSRPEATAAFAARLAVVSARADLAIYNSAATREAAEAHMSGLGRIPPGVVAHLGVAPAPADPAALPPLPRDRALFTVLGTIEPRKNHALLLDVWEEMAAELPVAAMPLLAIAGARGWRNEALFHRLDASPLRGRHILEMPGLPDAAVTALLQRSRALLFPSLAEGFGLPACEAAALAVPVICSDLPVFREILGDYPVYASISDRYGWRSKIQEFAVCAAPDARCSGFVVPTWDAHFKRVLSRT